VRTGPLTVEYLPGNPENVLHVTVSSVAGAGNYCCIRQSIEDVRATAARVCSVSFWLNSSVDCNISFVCRQNLGAESVFVHGQKYAVKSATWNRFTSTFSVPSIIGKTLISGSHALECYLYFDAGTNFNSQTQSLGHQSVQARVTNAMFSFSNVPIDFFGQDNGIEDVLAERYYEKSCVVNPNKEDVGFNGAYTSVQVVGAGIETLLGHIRFNTRKRITPTVRLLNPVGLTNSAVRNDTINANSSTATVTRLNSEAFNVMYTTAPGSAVGNLNAVQWDADAEFY
jgi:hypothetical protein